MTYATTLSNWHWSVLDLMKEHDWCRPSELEDEAQQIYLKKQHEEDTAFQADLWFIIESDFEAWRTIEDGHINQNREVSQSGRPFPRYLQNQVKAPFGVDYSQLLLTASQN